MRRTPISNLAKEVYSREYEKDVVRGWYHQLSDHPALAVLHKMFLETTEVWFEIGFVHGHQIATKTNPSTGETE